MSKGIFVRMDEDMIKKIDRLAKKLKRTRSDIIRDAVKALLMREEMMTDKMRGLVKIKLKDIENLAFELKGL
ncbi:MAG: CopG family ribbon-helix-helix protein [Candidatus Njordarchaeia archaeon]